MNGLSYGVIDRVASTFKRVLAYNRKEFVRKGSKKGRLLVRTFVPIRLWQFYINTNTFVTLKQ